MHHKPYTKNETQPMFLSALRKQSVISSHNSSVVVCVNVLASGQVDVMSTQSSCVVVCVNVLASGQVEVSRDTNLDCSSWRSFILSIRNPQFALEITRCSFWCCLILLTYLGTDVFTSGAKERIKGNVSSLLSATLIHK